jgi:hypothetical protein
MRIKLILARPAHAKLLKFTCEGDRTGMGQEECEKEHGKRQYLPILTVKKHFLVV